MEVHGDHSATASQTDDRRNTIALAFHAKAWTSNKSSAIAEKADRCFLSPL